MAMESADGLCEKCQSLCEKRPISDVRLGFLD